MRIRLYTTRYPRLCFNHAVWIVAQHGQVEMGIDQEELGPQDQLCVLCPTHRIGEKIVPVYGEEE